jgi:hypothetical protein
MIRLTSDKRAPASAAALLLTFLLSPAVQAQSGPPSTQSFARSEVSGGPEIRLAQASPSNRRRPSASGQNAPSGGPGGAQASLVTSSGDWKVYTAQVGRSKICYALSEPKERRPKDLNRDPAYLFVSFRPAENVSNEVALVLGFPAREEAPAQAEIGTTSFDLLTKDQSAWLKNPAEEGRAVQAMIRGRDLAVKVQSARGNQLTDTYSLTGFTDALGRAKQECGAG